MTKSTLRLHTRQEFTRRVLGFLALGAGFLVVSLGVGVLGYRFIAGLSWIDALFNAAMILTGMGPADPMPDDAAKIFAGVYEMVAGLAWTALLGGVLYPFIHWMLHALHLEMRGNE